MISPISDNKYVEEFVADKESDIETLSKEYNLNTCAPGSTCIVIETSNVYMMNSEGKWELI